MAIEKIIIIRHAHRDTSDREQDNGLSPKGEKQVRALFDEKRLFQFERPVMALSSPKKRCVETITPLAEKWGVRVDIEKGLDEQDSSESASQFLKRISDFIDSLEAINIKTVALCSHGDWIPAAIEYLRPKASLSFSHDLPKAGFAIFKREDKRWVVQ